MWKLILSFLGFAAGAFVGLELVAWTFYSSFDAGGMMGLLVGLPVGAIIGVVGGILIGRKIDRAGGIQEVDIRPRHVLAAAICVGILVLIAIWMSTIRPFYWIQT